MMAPLLHPFCFAVVFVLAFYAQNMGEQPLGVVVFPLAVVLAAVLVTWGAATLALRDTRRAALLTTVLLVPTLFYGDVYHSISPVVPIDLRPFGYRFGLGVVLLPLFLAGMLAAAIWVIRSRRPLARPTKVLNAIGACLLVASVGHIGFYHAKVRLSAVRAPTAATTRPMRPVQSASLPNIVYIVLDAYVRDDVLRELFDYDNEPFLEALEARGLFVARQARANYPHTTLSQASTLNMTYLDDVIEREGPDSHNRRPLNEMITNNLVCAQLVAGGYELVNLPSGYAPTEKINRAVLWGSTGIRSSDFEAALLDRTLAGSALRHTVGRWYLGHTHDQRRARILASLENLPKACAGTGKPVFVYAHILCPHPPFLFGANGEHLNPPYLYHCGGGEWRKIEVPGGHSRLALRKGYVGQLQYLNRRMCEVVDAIKRQSSRPAVIIIQADHGTRSLDFTEPGAMKERMSILNAYLFPDGDYEALYEGITPVNSFRVVLNKFFGAALPMLPDRSYYSEATSPYRLEDVTERATQGALTTSAGGGSARR
jgi:hypothetical protein